MHLHYVCKYILNEIKGVLNDSEISFMYGIRKFISEVSNYLVLTLIESRTGQFMTLSYLDIFVLVGSLGNWTV